MINHNVPKTNKISVSGSLVNNQSIMKEVMRLEHFDLDHVEQKYNQQLFDDDGDDDDNNLMEIKSNENSEDIAMPSKQQSFAELSMNTIKDENNGNNHQSPSFDKHDDHRYNNRMSPDSYDSDTYHPFGVMMQNQQNSQNVEDEYVEKEAAETEESMVEDLEALYAENLKQHGFDADKFRNANLFNNELMNGKKGFNEKGGGSNDISSFASSQLSSKSEEIINTRKLNQNYDQIVEEHDFQIDDDDDDIHSDDYNEYDDLMYKELSRPNSMYENTNNVMIEPSIQESVKQGHGQQVSNIMDDEDEELMDAILSLDLES